MHSLEYRHLTLLPALALAAACGTQDAENLGSVHVKSALISAAAGGELAVTAQDYAPFAGVKVQFPAGALAQDTKITVDIGAASLMDEDATSVGPVVELGPSGTTFSTPVTITLPVSSAFEADLARVYVKHGDGTREVIVPASITYDAEAGTMVFSVSHFTTYEPGRSHDRCRHHQCPDPTECTPEECDPAPGAPNYTCTDGSVGGPICERNPAGTCGWNFRTCPGPACSDDSDCPPAQLCINGTCALGGGTACNADADCDPTEVCLNGACVPGTAEVCGNTVCATGTVCCNPSCGICTSPNGACDQRACLPECTSDADCPPGDTCDPATGTCESGPVTGEPCGNNLCGTGTYCCNPSCGICAPLGAGCTEQECLACNSDTDCGPATSCINGYCR